MPALVRKTQKVFAGDVANSGQFGSGVAGTKITSTDLDTLQALTAFVEGLESGVLDIDGEITPILEEIQGLHYIATRQLAYLFERGIPEYDSGTNYFIKSIVVNPGTYDLYGSLTDDNIGNALSDETKWVFLGSLKTAFNTLQQNNFVVEPTTNDSYASSDAVNPMGLFFDDGKPRYGKVRYSFSGLVAIQKDDNFPTEDSSGRQGFHPLDAKTGKPLMWAACYGGGWTVFNDATSGIYINTQVTGDYIIFTEIFNEVCMLSEIQTSNTRNTDNDIYLDGFNAGDPTGGTDTTNDLDQQGDEVLHDNLYMTNQTQKLDLNTPAQGVHTVKVVCGSDAAVTVNLRFYGIELINELTASTQEIAITSSVQNVQGKEVSVVAKIGSNSLDIKEGFTGTKGGFNGKWVDKNGDWQYEKQEPLSIIDTVVTGNGVPEVTCTSEAIAISLENTIIRLTKGVHKALLKVQSRAGAVLTLDKDYDGSGITAFNNGGGMNQFQDDQATNSDLDNLSDVSLEMYTRFGTATDFSNSEPLRRYIGWDSKLNKIVARNRSINYSHIGNQLSDDFTSLQTGNNDVAFTMDDGSFTAYGEDLAVENGGLRFNQNGSFLVVIFYGEGIALDRLDNAAGGADTYDYYIDGVKIFTETAGDTKRRITPIVSDLPLGFHTLIIDRVAAATYIPNIYNFIVYLPKQPVLTENFHYTIPNYVLANQVITSLPTRNIASYNGAIDQGVISKMAVREYIYTGSGTWNYGAVDTTSPCGRVFNIPNANDGEAQLEVYGSGYFRTWMFNGSVVGTQDISVDGVKIHDYTPANTGYNGIIYDTVGAELNTLGAEGLHTILVERDNTTDTFGFYRIDFHCSIWNPNQWRSNPEPNRLIDGQSVIDNRKLSIYDEKPVARIKKIYSNIASSTNISTTDLLLCSTACDFIEARIKGEAQVKHDAGLSDRRVSGFLKIDGVTIKEYKNQFAAQNTQVVSQPEDTYNFLKTQRVELTLTSDLSNQWEVQNETTRQPFIEIENISEDD